MIKIRKKNYVIFFLILIFIIYFKYFKFNVLLILFVFFEFIIILKSKNKVIYFLSILILISFIIDKYFLNKFNYEKNYYEGIIKFVYEKSLIVKVNHINIYINLKYINVSNNYFIGDTLCFYGDLIFVENVNDSFAYFLNSNDVDFYIYPEHIEVIEKNIKFLRRILYENIWYSESFFSNFALVLLFGNYQNQLIEEGINKLGISYLFVISGMHVSFIYFFINKYLKFKNIDLIIFIILLFFMYLLYFPISGMRALFTIFIIKSFKLSNIDSLSITGIIFIIINPNIIFSYSWLLSFISTWSIYLIINKYPNNSIKPLLICVVAFCSTFPIVINWNSSFNLLAPLLSIILTPIITFVYFITIILYPFKFIWLNTNLIFEFIFLLINFFTFLKINISINEINFTISLILIIYNFSLLCFINQDLINRKLIILMYFPIILLTISSI